jgi:ATP-binding cassette subfamily B protein
MIASILAAALVGIFQSWLSNLIGQGVMFDLRRRLYDHLSRMSMAWFTANRTGDTLSRVNNDVGSIQGVVSDTFGSVRQPDHGRRHPAVMLARTGALPCCR